MSHDDSARTPTGPSEKVRSAAALRYLAAREARRTAAPERLLPAPPPDTDTLWRGLLRDGQMRVIVARTTTACRDICERLGTGPTASRAIAELFCGAQLLRATIHPDEALQLAGQQQGGIGSFVVDIFDDGSGRATLRHPHVVGAAVAGGSLQVGRVRRGVGQYRSSVAMGHGEGVPALLMRYLLDSEQLPSLIDIEVQLDDAGLPSLVVGSLVQLMPEGSHEDLARLVGNVEHAGTAAAAMTTDDPDAIAWAERLLAGFHWDQVARQEVTFGCRCSAERVISMLASLPPEDLRTLIEATEQLESTCDFCQTAWTTSVHQLLPLLETSS